MLVFLLVSLVAITFVLNYSIAQDQVQQNRKKYILTTAENFDEVAITSIPASSPVRIPTKVPTRIPTKVPTRIPTKVPTRIPTKVPTRIPTKVPARIPTKVPTRIPTTIQSPRPSNKPSRAPTRIPSTLVPSKLPTNTFTIIPTYKVQTYVPTMVPTRTPTSVPKPKPTTSPTSIPLTRSPTAVPTRIPTNRPVSVIPSARPTNKPTTAPSTNTVFKLTGIVHHWNFDEGPDWHDDPFLSLSRTVATVAHDSVGTAHATLANMNGSNWISGKQYTGLYFGRKSGGNNQLAQEHLSTTTDLSQTLGKTCSFSLWLRTKVTGSSSVTTSPSITGVYGAGGVVFGWIDGSGKIGLAVENTLVVMSSTAVTDGSWHHIVLTRDINTGLAQVYVDGLLSQSAAGPTGSKTSSFYTIARVGSKFFTGAMDQTYIFNRVVTASEVGVLRSNHAPKCWDINTGAGVSNRPFTTASVFSNVFDVDRDPLFVKSWTNPNYGTVTHNADGSFMYTSSTLYTGSDSFVVVIHDGAGGYSRCNMTINVVNEPAGGGGVAAVTYIDFQTVRSNGADLAYQNNLRVPRLIDWNNDGKLDLLIGSGGYIYIHLNTGKKTSPEFGGSVRVLAGGSSIYSGDSWSTFALADMNADGKKDIVLADSTSKLRVYLNTASIGSTPTFSPSYFILDSRTGSAFVIPDRRFDIGDWDADNRPDLMVGAACGDVKLFMNTNTAVIPKFATGNVIFTQQCYNWYPRLFDISSSGRVDLVSGVNWGSIDYVLDPFVLGVSDTNPFVVTDTAGDTVENLQSLTDGPIIDFGDLNGDGNIDMVMGGHSGTNFFIAFSQVVTIQSTISTIESIYNANLVKLGKALSANNGALLKSINYANKILINHLTSGTLTIRENVYDALINHIKKYPFLKYQNLNTTRYHHIPSLFAQNWVMLHNCLPDTPSRRLAIANALEVVGIVRTIYLEQGLVIGDNYASVPAAYKTIREFMSGHSRQSFPDAIVTIDQFNGDGGGGFTWTPTSSKNIFADSALGNSNEWNEDLFTAIETLLGPGTSSGDGFTFVLGHEVTHSMDNYVRTRANQDLYRRWGQMLTYAAGPDVVMGADGWWDWDQTETHFKKAGLWDGDVFNWISSWTNYWNTGYGSTFKDYSFMRSDISWFMDNPQESLATQANQHWANGLGRLVGAVARFNRGSTLGLSTLKAPINEVVTFIDFLSTGMNRVNLQDTKYDSDTGFVIWNDHFADLERNNLGYITRITCDGLIFTFDVSNAGLVKSAKMTGNYVKYTQTPTKIPTRKPSLTPSAPTPIPTAIPSRPTSRPSVIPSAPSSRPTAVPTQQVRTIYKGFVRIRGPSGDLIYAGNPKVPRLIDWNNDGKLDLLIGSGGYIYIHLNTGNSSTPSFSTGVKVNAGGSSIYSGDSWSTFALADMNADGKKDIILADSTSKLRVYLNTAAAGFTPTFVSYYMIQNYSSQSGDAFVIPDRRFDIGDWDADGTPDLLGGVFCGDVKLYLGKNSASSTRYGNAMSLFTAHCYNWYPRLMDINGNGRMDLINGINWGDIQCWLDPSKLGIATSITFTVLESSGKSVDMKAATEGPIVDFGDLNGDGKLDMVIGAHDKNYLYVAYLA